MSGEPVLEVADGFETWRDNRDDGWFRDIGYSIQGVLSRHRYAYERKGIKPDDPGWHECSCGAWQGYWSGFHPHVADHLRDLVTAPTTRTTQALRECAGEAEEASE